MALDKVMDFKGWLHLCERNYVDGKPFLDSLDALKYIRDKHPSPQDLVVTFTQVDKVGINPQSPHSTPLGIYVYTIDYVIEVGQRVEFAGEAPYIQVCELTNPERVMHMRKTGSNEGIELLYRVFDKDKVDKALSELRTLRQFQESWASFYANKSNYALMWNVTSKLCKRWHGSAIVNWNKAFRDMGISGFIDDGTGTIFGTEPYQGVLFRASDLRLLHSLENTRRKFKDMPHHTKKGEYEVGSKIRSTAEQFFRDFFRAGTDEEKSYLLNTMYHVAHLISSAPNVKYMVDLILKHKTKWTSDEVAPMLSQRATERYGLREMARALGDDRMALLDRYGIERLMVSSPDKREIAEVLGGANLDKLESPDIRDILLSDHSHLAVFAEVLTARRMDKLTGTDIAEVVQKMDAWYNEAENVLSVLTPANLQSLRADHLGVPISRTLIEDSKNPERMRGLLARYLGEV